MSHDVHTASAPSDHDRPLPASAGVSAGVKLLVVAGVALCILQGSFVAAASGFGRVWPSANSVNIQLPPAALK
jgi:hypothetical protein